MGKRVLSTELKANPTVRLADRIGSRFVGKYVASRDASYMGKPIKVHEFTAVDGDALITVKDGSTYKEANVNQGDLVTVFGSKAIDAAILQVNAGETLEIIFNGEKKLKGGRRFNDYAVAVLEDA
jgi:hypothetical protein